MTKRLRNLVGMKFGRLTALSKAEKRGSSWYYLFECECGNQKIARGADVKLGRIVSCGCFKSEVTSIATKERHRRNRESGKYLASNKDERRMYEIWRHMKERCDNPKNISYAKYGARGISYTEEWSDFRNFLSDMQHGYEDGLSLDRIDNDKGYCLENCRWATLTVQQNNRSFNRLVEYKGETYTLVQISRKSGLNYHTLRCRLDNGWEIDRAVETPARSKAG